MSTRIGWILMAVLAAVAAIPGAGSAEIRMPALIIVLSVGPGWWLARRLSPDVGAVQHMQMGIVLTPLLIGLPVAALHVFAGWDLVTGGRVVMATFAFLAVLEAVRPFHGESQGARVIAWPALLWALLTLVFLVMNPILAPRSDGWFHSAVAIQISGMGVPPEDPYFAGLPLLYFWGYHLWGAVWLALEPGHSVWVPLVTFNVTAALAVVLGVCAIAARLGAGPRAQWWAAGAAVLGYAPFAWLLPIARSMVGDVRGLSELERIVAGGGTTLKAFMSGGMLNSSMVFFGDKYMVLTPFGLGLALTCTFLIALWDLYRKPRWQTAVLIALLQASALFIHTFIAFVTGILAAAVWGLILLAGVRRRSGHTVRTLVLLAVGMVTAMIAMQPYVTTILSGKRGVLPWGMSAAAVTTLIHGGLFLVPAACVWLWRTRSKVIGSFGLLFVCGVITVLGLTVGLPGANQAKFFNLLFLVTAAPAALLVSEWDARWSGWRRFALRIGLAVAVLPTFLAGLWGYAIEDGEGTWHEPTAAERAALEWIAKETPVDAMFVDRSGASDLIGLTGRSVVWGNEWGERDWGLDPEAQEDRRRAARELAAGWMPSARTVDLLRGLDRPVFVMARRSAAADSNSAWNRLPGRDNFTVAFTNGDVVLYRYELPEFLEAGP